jgi:Insertion element 4 transposase N-terminal
VVRVAGGRFAPGHIGELTRIVPFEMVDAVLAETRSQQQRVRDLPSRVVVYGAADHRTQATVQVRRGRATLRDRTACCRPIREA